MASPPLAGLQSASFQHESWPCETLQKGRLRCAGCKQQCVLVTTGAMNPPHLGHVELLRQARFRLEAEGYGVLAAWMSPTQDGYVQPKAASLGTIGLSGEFRLKTAQLMLEGDDFVALGAWEAQYVGHWPDFPAVTEQLQKELFQRAGDMPELIGKSGKVRVFYACGTDHAGKCGLYRGLDPLADRGVVVVPRAGEASKAESPKSLVFVAQAVPGAIASFSSTKVRKALGSGDEAYIGQALSEAAAKFLLSPTAEQKQMYSKDFVQLMEK